MDDGVGEGPRLLLPEARPTCKVASTEGGDQSCVLDTSTQGRNETGELHARSLQGSSSPINCNVFFTCGGILAQPNYLFSFLLPLTPFNHVLVSFLLSYSSL